MLAFAFVMRQKQAGLWNFFSWPLGTLRTNDSHPLRKKGRHRNKAHYDSKHSGLLNLPSNADVCEQLLRSIHL